MAEITLIIILAVFVLVIGFILGTLVGFSSYGTMAQNEIRNRLAKERYDAKPLTPFSESRREKRLRIDAYPLVSIKAPVLDSAGVPTVNEELIFPAHLTDISRNGCAIISTTYLQKGLDIQIACNDARIGFGYRPAEVRNISLTPRGVRIGLQFFKPLNLPSSVTF